VLTFTKIDLLQNYLKLEGSNKNIGFVPTMGALHAGHLSLIQRALAENTLVVCSIFVNPTQFTNADDLDNYPKTLEADKKKLESAGCHVLFSPSVAEMYEVDQQHIDIELGALETVMEGRSRPGHFKGVCTIVYKLFTIVKPTLAYFGNKDFQQVAIVRELIKKTEIPVRLVACDIVREKDGLAMSSRNTRLTTTERKEAPALFKILKKAALLAKSASPEEVIKSTKRSLEILPLVRLDYFEIVDAHSLKPIFTWGDAADIRACIAVYLGNIRLIDNIAIIL
jgi:pantoate--beta-alanine ligase